MKTNGHRCIVCQKPVERNWPARQCNFCYEKMHKTYGMTFGSRLARAELAAAIKKGIIPPITNLLCVDCGKTATEYDHRDYNNSLDVAPVCHACNMRRGKAIPLRKVA